jgi:4-hydroxy-tetrahydrodipicolinate synthase
VVREAPEVDPYLTAIIAACGLDRIVSGIGERPAVVHWMRFGIRAFTSGSVCVGPRLSTDILHALQADAIDRAEALRQHFLPLEDLRDAHSPILVLHAAVQAAGIARTGAIGAYLSNIEDEAVLADILEAARALRRRAQDAMTVDA